VYTKSIKGLLCSAVLLMLSLFSKETAITFVVITLLYLAWWDRKRAYWFAAIMAPITGLYLILKIHAIGFASASTIAPIDRVNFAGRLLNAPSIVLFYIGKFMFPWKLATEYYWVYSAFSVKHFVEPLLIDLIAASIVIYLAVRIHNESSKAIFYTFIFFAVWLMMGLLLTLQIVPLDMTVAESWFYFPMVGLLGMIGIVLMEIPIRMRPNWMLLVVGVLLISILGFRSAIRGEDWRSETKLAYANIAASPSDYSADNLITYSLINQGNYSRAKNYAQYSVHLFPTYDNYNNLGLAYAGLGNYPMALTAYKNGLSYGNYNAIFENVGELSLVYGTPSRDKIFLKGALAMYPEDPILLTDLAIFEDAHNDNKDARVAIFHAREYGFVSNYLYDGIMNDQAIRLNLPDVGKSLYIHGFN
jgi:tetratricopeptide (TPR) repeat protein